MLEKVFDAIQINREPVEKFRLYLSLWIQVNNQGFLKYITTNLW